MCESVVMGVITVRVTVVEPAPDAMEVGEKVAVAPFGKPLTVNVIAAGKVVAGETGLTIKVKVAAKPGSMVAVVGELAVTEKSSTNSVSVVVVEAWLFESPR